MEEHNNQAAIGQHAKSKPILQFSVLCDGVARQGNKPVFFGVFSNLMRTGVIPQFFIVNRWIYGQGTFKQKIVIKDPELKTVISEVGEVEFILKDEITGADVINGFVNAKFETSGVYWIEVLLDDEVVISYPLPVFDQSK